MQVGTTLSEVEGRYFSQAHNSKTKTRVDRKSYMAEITTLQLSANFFEKLCVPTTAQKRNS